ncbi:hypothetical protein [Halostagnicola sp. A-GB9-2]|uniref:hypothetical protein n=1 Tax=Halostagnicola sp. A-GB9-2 TaxID=3048066 RepID=UPI0024BFE2CF|nr:hypothetical protein [Halostagnicola sp. A-GB9-2]MDJ1433595.1 hypothetical protein [Halostagnicola sp. A-GB9-2]
MVELYWPRSTTFLGPNEHYSGPGVHDVPDNLEEGFRARGWEDPPDEADDSEDEDEIDERALDLADSGYQDAVDAVEAGEADEYLDDLENVDDRSTVQDAIVERTHEFGIEE